MNLLDILSDRAEHQPNQKAYIFLLDGETELASLTYGELNKQASSIASHLQSFKGERALLLYPSGLDFITAFFGCLYAGVVAVPVYPPRRNQKLSRLLSIADDAQATVALTTTSILTDIEKRWASDTKLAQLRLIATDTIESAPKHFVPISVTPDNLAFLQYTSGSTAVPKGVMLSHGNLLHNSAAIYSRFEHTQNSRGVTWLPHYHDMGLIGGLLQPLYGGFPVTLMPPVAFLQKPLRWLEAISQTQATTSGAPNFAYDLCVSRITPEQRAKLDLSSWELAFTGAEPVRAETMKRFADYFSSCGFRYSAFYPCYGMAETTLIVAGGLKAESPTTCSVNSALIEQNQVVIDTGEDSRPKILVGCGKSLRDGKIIIVDPQTLNRCSSDRVGEIWVSGSSVAKGYWNREKQSQKTFHAYLADNDSEPFLRTGDLGFIRDDELFITGRIKDLMVFRGRNCYPQDIEITVEKCHQALLPSCGAAFSIEISGQEKLIIATEVKRSYLRKLNVEEVIQAILREVAVQHGLQVYAIVLLKTASLIKTTSGKVQRSATKVSFLTGKLNVIADWHACSQSTSHRNLETELTNEAKPSKLLDISSLEQNSNRIQEAPYSSQEIKAWLISKVAEKLEVSSEKIEITEPLANYGLSSLAAVSLSGELQEWLFRELSPTLLYNYPTIQALAEYLAVPEAKDGEAIEPTITKSQEEIADESIAIIGLGCRFPGATDPESFWQLLRDGIDAITDVPAERWDIDALYDQDLSTPGKMNTRWGGFLEQVDMFEPEFFGISSREAQDMDPQQRLLLEVSWEALENACLIPSQLEGSKTGVFVGISSQDYSQLQFAQTTKLNAYSGTGNAKSVAASRLSYLLDLRGPSWAVDTACSSSLVAVHQACQSLRQGECNLALVGGVNLILAPQLTITFSQTGMMASDGRCKTFDAAADGYVRGEGCGVIVLKPLRDALRDGDNILATIRGSSVNQDDRSNGLTAPNGRSQQEVIRQALSNANVRPAEISYVEAHGTGTSLGDPIELNSLKEVLLQDRSEQQSGWIGSVKTNIGHLEAASGIAGLIKVVLSLQHKQIPPHLHLKQLNSHIELENTPLSIPTEKQQWQSTELRLAGVSSFGFSGTNAHVVLEEAPVKAKKQRSKTVKEQRLSCPLHLLTLSAKTSEALVDLVASYQNHLEANRELELADICYTANTGRTHFNHRLVTIASNQAELCKKLSQYQRGRELTGLFSGEIVTNAPPPKVAFLFTGQGSQYINMGQQLYKIFPVFREVVNKCNQILLSELEYPLLSVLYPEILEDKEQNKNSSLINQTAYTQPAIFAIEYALFCLWQSWGIRPNIVMGHSLGEYVAAAAAGVFSLEEGLKLIATRGRLMQQLPQHGKMVSVMAPESKLEQLISSYEQKVVIAAINGSESVVISGETEAIDSIVHSLELEEIKIKPLQVSHAFHSPLMSPILAEFETAANEITYSKPTIPLISNVTGKRAEDNITTAAYWVNHVQQPIQFTQSMNTLKQEDYKVFLEIGAKPILLGLGREYFPENYGIWLPSLHSGMDSIQSMLSSLGQLYTQGCKVNWWRLNQDHACQKTVLPTYPFQRQKYWIQSKMSTLSSDNDNDKVETVSSSSNTNTFTGKIIRQQIELMSQQLEILQGNASSQNKNKSLTSYDGSAQVAPHPINVTKESNQKTLFEKTSSLLPSNSLVQKQTENINLETISEKPRFRKQKNHQSNFVSPSSTVIIKKNNQDFPSFSFYYFGNYQSEFKSNKYDLLFEGAKFADKNGFKALWIPERHFHAFGGFSPNPSVIAAALARETQNIQLRAGSVVLPINHPIRVAEEWSIVDNLSQGRVGISFASGWHPHDFVFAPESFGKHRETMFQEIKTVKKLWRGETVKYIDGRGNKVDIKLFPMPMQSDLSTWITIVKNPVLTSKQVRLEQGF